MPESRCWTGVEVFDGGGLGEAEALGWAGASGVGREGGDAGGAGEEGGLEVWTELPMGVMQPRPVTTTRFTDDPLRFQL